MIEYEDLLNQMRIVLKLLYRLFSILIFVKFDIMDLAQCRSLT